MLSSILSPLVSLVIKSFFIFVIIIFITRMGGLRTFAKMSSIDFASTIAIGSVIASTILSESTTLLTGGVALASIVGLQLGAAKLMRHSKLLNNVMSNQPLLLMRNGKILEDNLGKSGVSKEDLMAKLREANALKLADVKAVIFETTGDIAVLHGSDAKDIDEELLLGVAPYGIQN